MDFIEKYFPAAMISRVISNLFLNLARQPSVETPPTGIKFPEFKTSGVFLRSQRMKLPPSVGQKKSKAIEQMLTELGLEVNPMPTEDICQHFNELRSDLVLLFELKLGLSTCEYELQALRHQYEALAPGKTLEIPPTLLSITAPPAAASAAAAADGHASSAPASAAPGAEADARPKALSEVIDVVGSATTPMVYRHWTTIASDFDPSLHIHETVANSVVQKDSWGLSKITRILVRLTWCKVNIQHQS